MYLADKIKNKEAKIGVVGLGYVGIPLVLAYAEAGFEVVGFDIDQARVSLINDGRSPISHIPNDSIQSAVDKRFSATTHFAPIAHLDAIIITVPTPIDEEKNPDLSYVLSAIGSVLPHMHSGQLISLESTTYPGTTEEMIKPLIEEKGFEIGEDIYLVYSPEREDPGRSDFTINTIPKICAGVTARCQEMGIALYKAIIEKVVPVSSPATAEMTKIYENIHRAVNIALVNEMKMIASELDIDIHEVVRAASTKPFGFAPYVPGPGTGGHCIPVDPFYLNYKAKQRGMRAHFVELAGKINEQMPEYAVSKVCENLAIVKDARVLVLGVAYKKNVDDLRESPALDIIKLLEEKGIEVDYSDPYIASFSDYSLELESVELNSDVLSQYDCVIIATDHDEFDYDLIRKNANLIVDTRGVYQDAYENVIKA